MTSPEVDLPVKRFRGLQKRFDEAIPGLFRYLDEVRRQSSAKWPSWCYAPIELVRGLLVGAAENSGIRNPKPLLTDLVAVAILAAWRTTQGIYVFDPDAQHDIWNTPVSGDIPSDVLFHLPQWCCFVSAPMRVFDEEVLGFLVSLNSDSERLPPELWLLMVYKEEGADVEPLCLTLVGITEAIQGGLAKLKRTTLAATAQQKEAALGRLNKKYERHIQDLEGMVSLTLYLASENREISNPLGHQPQNPGPTSTRSGRPSPSPTKWMSDCSWVPRCVQPVSIRNRMNPSIEAISRQDLAAWMITLCV
jgi:hypothetical protein